MVLTLRVMLIGGDVTDRSSLSHVHQFGYSPTLLASADPPPYTLFQEVSGNRVCFQVASLSGQRSPDLVKWPSQSWAKQKQHKSAGVISDGNEGSADIVMMLIHPEQEGWKQQATAMWKNLQSQMGSQSQLILIECSSDLLRTEEPTQQQPQPTSPSVNRLKLTQSTEGLPYSRPAPLPPTRLPPSRMSRVQRTKPELEPESLSPRSPRSPQPQSPRSPQPPSPRSPQSQSPHLLQPVSPPRASSRSPQPRGSHSPLSSLPTPKRKAPAIPQQAPPSRPQPPNSPLPPLPVAKRKAPPVPPSPQQERNHFKLSKSNSLRDSKSSSRDISPSPPISPPKTSGSYSSSLKKPKMWMKKKERRATAPSKIFEEGETFQLSGSPRMCSTPPSGVIFEFATSLGAAGCLVCNLSNQSDIHDTFAQASLIYVNHSESLQKGKRKRGTALGRTKVYQEKEMIAAVKSGNLSQVQKIIDTSVRKYGEEGQMVYIRCRDTNGETPLVVASRHGHLSLVQFLVSLHADIEARSSSEQTALMVAAMKGHLDVVTYLVNQRANIQAKCVEGNTAVLYSAFHGHCDLFSYLMDIDRSCFLPSKGPEAIIEAAKGRHRRILKILIPLVKTLVDRLSYLQSIGGALLASLQQDDLSTVLLLLQYLHAENLSFADPAFIETTRRLYFFAISCGYPQVIEGLLDESFGVEQTFRSLNPNGDRVHALYLSCVSGQLEVAKLLLEKGAKFRKKECLLLLFETSKGLNAKYPSQVERFRPVMQFLYQQFSSLFPFSPYQSVLSPSLSFSRIQKIGTKRRNLQELPSNVASILGNINFSEPLLRIHSAEITDSHMEWIPWQYMKNTLSEVDLRNCHLSRIPPFLSCINSSVLTRIRMSGNPLTPHNTSLSQLLPSEIISHLSNKVGDEAKSLLYEMKVLVVGDASVGKSTLLANWRGENVGKNLLTDGIQVHQIVGESAVFHCWDFAGQEVYRYTHQLFLTGKATYLFLCKITDPIEESWRQLNFWMGSIAHSAPKAQCFMVATHFSQISPEVAMSRMKGLSLQAQMAYGNRLTLLTSHLVDCVEGCGLPELWKEMEKVAVSHFKSITANEDEARSSLSDCSSYLKQTNSAPVVSYQTALDAMYRIPDLQIKEKSLKTLHDLGEITLIDRQDFTGDDAQHKISFVVLDPRWLAKTLATLITVQHAFTCHAVISLSELQGIWREIPPSLQTHLLKLLGDLDIIHRLDQTKIVVPCLLPDYQPPFRNLVQRSQERGTSQILRSFLLRRGSFHCGVIGKALVAMFRYGNVTKAWRTGCMASKGKMDLVLWQEQREFDDVLVDGIHIMVASVDSTSLSSMSNAGSCMRRLHSIVENILTEFYSLEFEIVCSTDLEFFEWVKMKELHDAISHGRRQVPTQLGNPKMVELLVPDLLLLDMKSFTVEKNELRLLENVLGRGGSAIVVEGMLREKFIQRRNRATDTMEDRLDSIQKGDEKQEKMNFEVEKEPLFRKSGRMSLSLEQLKRVSVRGDEAHDLFGDGVNYSEQLLNHFDSLFSLPDTANLHQQPVYVFSDGDHIGLRSEKVEQKIKGGGENQRIESKTVMRSLGVEPGLQNLTKRQGRGREKKVVQEKEVKEELSEGGKEICVAVKIFSTDVNIDVASIIYEVYLMSTMQHPCIVNLYGIFIDALPPYQPTSFHPPAMVLELISGGDLLTQLVDPILLNAKLCDHCTMLEKLLFEEREKHVIGATDELDKSALDLLEVGDKAGCSGEVEEFLGAVVLQLAQRDRTAHESRSGAFEKVIAAYDKQIPLIAPIGWSTMLRIAADVAAGMNFLHSCDPPIVHRDLKSPNIFLTSPLLFGAHLSSSSPVLAKVGDFGLSAELTGAALRRDLGSDGGGKLQDINPRWSAPEILVGSDYSVQSDVYAFALFLWELRYRKMVFQDESKGECFVEAFIQSLVTSGKRPQLKYNDPFDKLIQACWDPVPEARPSFQMIYESLSLISKEKAPDLTLHPLSFHSSPTPLSSFSAVPASVPASSSTSSQVVAPSSPISLKQLLAKKKVNPNVVISAATVAGQYIWLVCQDGGLLVLQLNEMFGCSFDLDSSFNLIRDQRSVGLLEETTTMTYNSFSDTIWIGTQSGYLSVFQSAPVVSLLVLDMAYRSTKTKYLLQKKRGKTTTSTWHDCTLTLSCGCLTWETKSGELVSVPLSQIQSIFGLEREGELLGIDIGPTDGHGFIFGFQGDYYVWKTETKEEASKWIKNLEWSLRLRGEEFALIHAAETRVRGIGDCQMGIQLVSCVDGMTWSVADNLTITEWQLNKSQSGSHHSLSILTPLRVLSPFSSGALLSSQSLPNPSASTSPPSPSSLAYSSSPPTSLLTEGKNKNSKWICPISDNEVWVGVGSLVLVVQLSYPLDVDGYQLILKRSFSLDQALKGEFENGRNVQTTAAVCFLKKSEIRVALGDSLGRVGEWTIDGSFVQWLWCGSDSILALHFHRNEVWVGTSTGKIVKITMPTLEVTELDQSEVIEFIHIFFSKMEKFIICAISQTGILHVWNEKQK